MCCTSVASAHLLQALFIFISLHLNRQRGWQLYSYRQVAVVVEEEIEVGAGEFHYYGRE